MTDLMKLYQTLTLEINQALGSFMVDIGAGLDDDEEVEHLQTLETEFREWANKIAAVRKEYSSE